MKAKENLVEAKKIAGEKAVGENNASTDFIAQKARVVTIFHTLEEFYADRRAVS